jgi:hypothetical protein
MSAKEKHMKANVGTIDRAIRAVLGLGLLSLILLLEGNARWLGLIGLVPLATAFLGWCPVYLPFGISTCATRQSR